MQPVTPLWEGARKGMSLLLRARTRRAARRTTEATGFDARTGGGPRRFFSGAVPSSVQNWRAEWDETGHWAMRIPLQSESARL